MATVKRKPRFKWSEQCVNTICERIAKGESLVSICSSKSMPAYRTVQDYLAANEEFAHRYAHAREDQADHYADEIVAIADNSDPADAAKTRIQIDARKWVASKLKPKKYSEKLAVGGADDLPAIRKSLAVSFVTADK